MADRKPLATRGHRSLGWRHSTGRAPRNDGGNRQHLRRPARICPTWPSHCIFSDLMIYYGCGCTHRQLYASCFRRVQGKNNFEPDPETSFGATSILMVEQTAIGAEEGEVESTVGHDTGNHVAKGNEGRTQRVLMRTLDSIVGLTPPTMIKVDVEGYEADEVRRLCLTHPHSSTPGSHYRRSGAR